MSDDTARDRLLTAVRALMDKVEIRDSGSLHQTMLVARAGLDAAVGRLDRVAVAAGATEGEAMTRTEIDAFLVAD